MIDDLYSGAIDWNRIYSTFHDPFLVANRVQEELDGSNTLVVFSGFQQTAYHLANQRPVTFVDYSSSITDHAKKQYPQLHEVHTGDITKLAALLPVPNIVIACRISAYWDAPEYFERLADSLLSFPRERVLIDFFDRDLVKPGQSLTFESEGGVGDWVFLDFEESNGKEPSICKAKLKVSYSLIDHSFSYEGYRSFFRKDEILCWGQLKLSDYSVTLGEPLLDNDPSFSLKLVRRKKG